MLEALKGLKGGMIHLPGRIKDRPDRTGWRSASSGSRR
jgi:hypothetical protein